MCACSKPAINSDPATKDPAAAGVIDDTVLCQFQDDTAASNVHIQKKKKEKKKKMVLQKLWHAPIRYYTLRKKKLTV